eukprot:m.5272 g.5272  ORF g.5272 m.5272 type:complete len:85 (+) comp4884_c0_seq1:140-394(+)
MLHPFSPFLRPFVDKPVHSLKSFSNHTVTSLCTVAVCFLIKFVDFNLVPLDCTHSGCCLFAQLVLPSSDTLYVCTLLASHHTIV